MQVFISWSGDRSKALGTALKEYLPLVIQSVVPWFSPEDIDKGSRWLGELSTQLQKQSVAIVCITPESANSSWLLFEAGALSKALEMSWVCPVLLGLEPTEIKGPLAQFQATRATKEDIRSLLGTINKRLDSPLTDSQIDKLHNLLWPDLEQKLAALQQAGPKTPAPHRSQGDILTEVLDRIRALERHLTEPRLADTAVHHVMSRPPAKNIRRNEAPPPDSETLSRRFKARAAGTERTIAALQRLLKDLPAESEAERLDLERQIEDEKQKLHIYRNEASRFEAKVGRAQQYRP